MSVRPATPDVCPPAQSWVLGAQEDARVNWELLRDLGEEERRLLLGRMHRHRYDRGEVVFHEGDLAETVHFIAQGWVVARRGTDAGSTLAFTRAGPGEAFGEMAMLADSARRTTTIVAIEPTVTLALRYADFERLCQAHPGVRELLVRLLAARVSRLSDHLLEALYVSSDERVARRLLDLCETYAAGAGAGAVRVPVTQTDLAELAGASRPTVNRVLARLAVKGVLTPSKGRVLVHDRAALRRAARLDRGPADSLAGTPPRRVPSAGRDQGSSPGLQRQAVRNPHDEERHVEAEDEREVLQHSPTTAPSRRR